MKPLKVSDVNNYIKKILVEDVILSNIEVEGEISNFKRHFSGHLYFSLKDNKGRIKCVMFKSGTGSNNIDLRDGQNIIVKGYISIYEKGGEYQLYVKDIVNKGLGELYKKFEELKSKLEEEGLFNQEYKRDMPDMPKKIGLVTSSTGAAIRDIITVIKRRYPRVEILIYPSLVQGDNAPMGLIKALKYLDSRKDVELIIFGRGGGSIEELFAFNDEDLARTIFDLKTPNISAVGHETDFTIADFVADLRAATPSVAAEIAVPDMSELLASLKQKERRLFNFWDYIITDNKRELKYLHSSLRYNSPVNRIREDRQNLDNLFKDICISLSRKVNNCENYLKELEKKLYLLNPIHSLEQGHGIITNEYGHIIKSVKDLNINQGIKIIMKDGLVEANIEDIKEGGQI